jgi:hypothetical protein
MGVNYKTNQAVGKRKKSEAKNTELQSQAAADEKFKRESAVELRKARLSAIGRGREGQRDVGKEPFSLDEYGDFPRDSPLVQEYVAGKMGIRLKPGKAHKMPRPSGAVATNMASNAKREFQDAMEAYRQRYWQAQAGGDVRKAAMLYGQANLPPDEVQKAMGDPEIASKRMKYEAAEVVDSAQRATSRDDLMLIQQQLEGAHPGVGNDSRVKEAINRAIMRVQEAETGEGD